MEKSKKRVKVTKLGTVGPEAQLHWGVSSLLGVGKGFRWSQRGKGGQSVTLHNAGMPGEVGAAAGLATLPPPTPSFQLACTHTSACLIALES